MYTLAVLTLIPVFCAAASLALRRQQLVGAIVAVTSWIHLGLIVAMVAPVLFSSVGGLIMPEGFRLDRLACGFLVLTAFVYAFSITHSVGFFAREMAGPNPPEPFHIRLFYCFSSLFLLSMVAVFCCDNLGYLWIAIEATTLLSAGLVYFGRDKHAIEATWKYLIVCSVGIAFALLGTVFLYASSKHGTGAGAVASLNITELISQAPQLQQQLRRLGFIFCFLGYGTKAGMFPLHSWLPDAHSEAPAPASAMLSGSLLNCALFAIFRLTEISTAAQTSSFTTELVIWSGTITVVAASLFLVRQHGLKRLWAYSSVENVGLMLVAIGLGSAPLFFLQAVNHSLAKVSLFLTSGNIIQMTGTKYLSKIRGLWKLSPCSSILLLLSAVAVTGLPPFGAFVPEWVIMLSTAQGHRWVQFGGIVIGLTISFVAVMYHIGRVLVGNPRRSARPFVSVGSVVLPAVLILSSLLLGITSSPISSGCNHVAVGTKSPIQ